MKVWPNPNAGEFNLELKGRSTSALLIRIFDNRGQIHYEKSIEELNETLVYSLKMLDISSGIYYLQVVDSKEVSTQQIIVNR